MLIVKPVSLKLQCKKERAAKLIKDSAIKELILKLIILSKITL